MKKKNSHHGKARKSQVSKPAKSANKDMMTAFQEFRRSSATDRHRMATDYRRRPKHIKKGWE